MKIIMLLVATLILQACAAPEPKELTALPPPAAFAAFGTLSSSGDAVESQASVTLTRLALYRNGVAARLRDGRISVTLARQALALSDGVRRDLERAMLERDTSAIRLADGQIQHLP